MPPKNSLRSAKPDSFLRTEVDSSPPLFFKERPIVPSGDSIRLSGVYFVDDDLNRMCAF